MEIDGDDVRIQILTNDADAPTIKTPTPVWEKIMSILKTGHNPNENLACGMVAAGAYDAYAWFTHFTGEEAPFKLCRVDAGDFRVPLLRDAGMSPPLGTFWIFTNQAEYVRRTLLTNEHGFEREAIKMVENYASVTQAAVGLHCDHRDVRNQEGVWDCGHECAQGQWIR